VKRWLFNIAAAVSGLLLAVVLLVWVAMLSNEQELTWTWGRTSYALESGAVVTLSAAHDPKGEVIPFARRVQPNRGFNPERLLVDSGQRPDVSGTVGVVRWYTGDFRSLLPNTAATYWAVKTEHGVLALLLAVLPGVRLALAAKRWWDRRGQRARGFEVMAP
jgi:hypothetical protein